MVTRDAAKIAGLGDTLGSLEQGRPADLVILERREEDPWENVVAADPSWVELVTIDGDLAYGRADWLSDAHRYRPERSEQSRSPVTGRKGCRTGGRELRLP